MKVKSLVVIASQEIFCQCYGSIHQFKEYAHFYCVCHLYQGCAKAKEKKNAIIFFRKDYCCVCMFYRNYYFEDLHNVKNDSFKL